MPQEYLAIYKYTYTEDAPDEKPNKFEENKIPVSAPGSSVF